MITEESAKEMFIELYERQGYIVIGQPKGAFRRLELGEKTKKVMQFDLGAEFVLSEKAKLSDWDRQIEEISRLRPQWKRLPKQDGCNFFKITLATKESIREAVSA